MDLRHVDGPMSAAEWLVYAAFFVLLLAGLLSVLVRCIRRSISLLDVASWIAALALGWPLARLHFSEEGEILLLLLVLLALMGAGFVLRLRADPTLRTFGARLSEAVALCAIAIGLFER